MTMTETPAHKCGELHGEHYEGRWWDCYACPCGWRVLAHRSRPLRRSNALVDHVVGRTVAEQTTGFKPRPLILERTAAL